MLAAMVMAGPVTTLLAAQPAPTREYQIKGVFLFNFLQFVEWPAAAFPDGDAPIRIGVLGDDPFGKVLEDTVRGELIRNRRLVVERSHHLAELKHCHLLFICRSENHRLDEILASLATRPVLTVCETTGFARQGGVIALFLEGKKVRFEINPATARQQGLKMSSQLLGLARIVEETPDKGGT